MRRNVLNVTSQDTCESLVLNQLEHAEVEDKSGMAGVVDVDLLDVEVTGGVVCDLQAGQISHQLLKNPHKL